MSEKYKRIQVKTIGWVVEFKNHGKPDGKWTTLPNCRTGESKSMAIWDFEGRCLMFYFIPHKIKKSKSLNAKYRWLKRNGLARCVPVYVEVQDG